MQTLFYAFCFLTRGDTKKVKPVFKLDLVF